MHLLCTEVEINFHPEPQKYVLLGYPADYRGYKLLEIDSMQEIITRHVVFHEEIYPFSHLSPSVFHTETQIKQQSETQNPHNPSPTSPLIPNTTNNQPDSAVTRAGRLTKPPTHLTDYPCNSVPSSSVYPISAHFSLSKLRADTM